MERSQLFDLMGELKLYGMKAAFDEIMATAVKRQHEPQRIIGDLLKAEIGEKQARSIKYQLTITKLPRLAVSFGRAVRPHGPRASRFSVVAPGTGARDVSGCRAARGVGSGSGFPHGGWRVGTRGSGPGGPARHCVAGR